MSKIWKLNKYIKSRTNDKSKNYVFIDEIQENGIRHFNLLEFFGEGL